MRASTAAHPEGIITRCSASRPIDISEALSRLRDLRNVQNSQKTPSTHPIWHIQRFISHDARQKKAWNTANLSFHPASADCTVETAEMAPETVSTEALSRLKDLRNVQNSQKTPSTHTIWHMQCFISHNARQTRSGTQQFSVFTL